MERPEHDFSFFQGGPFYRFFLSRHSNLMNAALIWAIGWLPLFILSPFRFTTWGAEARLPFLLDIVNHVRFFITLPILILGEQITDLRLRSVLRYFEESNVLSGIGLSAFHSILRSTARLRDSIAPELVMLALAWLLSLVWAPIDSPIDVLSWRGIHEANTSNLNLAGFWYVFISLPLYHFIILRWLWRFVLWIRLLYKTARLPLNIIASHPDGVGGLGFVHIGNTMFAILVFASSATLCAAVATLHFFTHHDVLDYKGALITFLLLSLIIFHVPLLPFTPRLLNSKKQGYLDYSRLAEDYAIEFNSKWIASEIPPIEPVLGSQDVQSLADLGQSFERIQWMRAFLINKVSALTVLLAAILPMIPLLLMKVGMKDLLSAVFRMLM